MLWVPQQIAHQANIIRGRYFYKHNDVGPLFFQGRMYGVPDSLVRLDNALCGNLGKCHLFRMAMMADPLRAPLPFVTTGTGLQQDFLLLQALPERRI